MQISVLGTGYLGATHAACLALAGHHVTGVDRDPDRVATLRRGRAPFHEAGLDDLLVEGLDSGRLRFCSRLEDVADAEVHFVCVGTPESSDPPGRLDLTALWGVLDDLGPLLTRPTLVVGRSTVPVGTAAAARDVVRAKAPAGPEVSLAWNPEFLREGHALADSLEPHRIVVGVDDETALRTLRTVYADWTSRGVPLLETDLATAELAKLSANAMLAIRVSTVNVLAELCEASGADVDDLVDIVGSDPRIGRSYLAPGLGYGGSCLPKDIRGLATIAGELGLSTAARFLHDADEVNLWQRERTTELAAELLDGDPRGRRVAVLGLTFKSGSDDFRESAAVDVADRLAARGAEITAFDPGARDLPPGHDWTPATSAEEACAEADLVLVLTDWPQFRDLDPSALARTVRVPRVIDARRVLDKERWQAAGWQHWGLGLDPVTATVRGRERAVPA
jgi:UDPglucose 6-dehydrogenase